MGAVEQVIVDACALLKKVDNMCAEWEVEHEWLEEEWREEEAAAR